MRAIHVIAAALLAVLLFVACGGGGGNEQAPGNVVTQDQLRSTLDLDLSSQAMSDGSYRLLLHGRQAHDLYQIGGTLRFDPVLYSIELVEAGGGLGGPEDSYFVDGQTVPGRLDFAYTKRWYGEGVSGDPLLLSVRVRPLAAFNEQDFSIDTSPGALRVRDSQKQNLQFSCDGRELGNE